MSSIEITQKYGRGQMNKKKNNELEKKTDRKTDIEFRSKKGLIDDLESFFDSHKQEEKLNNLSINYSAFQPLNLILNVEKIRSNEIQ